MYRLINDIMLINYIVNDQVLDIIKFVFAFKGGGGGGSPLEFWKTRFRENG